MSNGKTPEKPETADESEATSAWWNIIAWAAAVGAFVLAMVLSYREIHYNIPNDLRSPAILPVNAFLATLVAFGFAAQTGSCKRWMDLHLCLRFGLWAAAVFRLVPPIINEDVLFYKGAGTFDAPYVVLGACVHGALVTLLASPYAIRVLDIPIGTDNDIVLELCGAVVLVFFIVASVMRLLAEHWWVGFF
jgi:hypothetical protein